MDEGERDKEEEEGKIHFLKKCAAYSLTSCLAPSLLPSAAG